MTPWSARLPDFPWDQLEPAGRVAAQHPDGLVDLSMGTPVDPVPDVIRAALVAAANAPGYPATAGSATLRGAISDWVVRTCGAAPGFGVLPTIGTKELVAWLPTLLGLGPQDVVVIPEVCYPTYEVGALIAGARVIRSDRPAQLAEQDRIKLLWLNSPGNPTGRVMSATELGEVVGWARQRGVFVASDECYLPLGWDAVPVSVLSVCSGEYDGILAVHSLSKRSNFAGYRGGFLAGDPSLVRELLGVRKHAGMMVPTPVQAAMVAALGDENHVQEQRERYATRRALLLGAVKSAGFTVEHSEAGLYLWATRDEPCWQTVDWFAQRGVLVAPGAFYGPGGDRHIRMALTATDERVQAAADRLTR